MSFLDIIVDSLSENMVYIDIRGIGLRGIVRGGSYEQRTFERHNRSYDIKDA